MILGRRPKINVEEGMSTDENPDGNLEAIVDLRNLSFFRENFYLVRFLVYEKYKFAVGSISPSLSAQAYFVRMIHISCSQVLLEKRRISPGSELVSHLHMWKIVLSSSRDGEFIGDFERLL